MVKMKLFRVGNSSSGFNLKLLFCPWRIFHVWAVHLQCSINAYLLRIVRAMMRVFAQCLINDTCFCAVFKAIVLSLAVFRGWAVFNQQFAYLQCSINAYLCTLFDQWCIFLRSIWSIMHIFSQCLINEACFCSVFDQWCAFLRSVGSMVRVFAQCSIHDVHFSTEFCQWCTVLRIAWSIMCLFLQCSVNDARLWSMMRVFVQFSINDARQWCASFPLQKCHTCHTF